METIYHADLEYTGIQWQAKCDRLDAESIYGFGGTPVEALSRLCTEMLSRDLRFAAGVTNKEIGDAVHSVRENKR
jgi:hypothetical protein